MPADGLCAVGTLDVLEHLPIRARLGVVCQRHRGHVRMTQRPASRARLELFDRLDLYKVGRCQGHQTRLTKSRSMPERTSSGVPVRITSPRRIP